MIRDKKIKRNIEALKLGLSKGQELTPLSFIFTKPLSPCGSVLTFLPHKNYSVRVVSIQLRVLCYTELIYHLKSVFPNILILLTIFLTGGDAYALIF